MSILINKNTRVVVQGITGKEGSRAAREMNMYGTVVLAGVTPGKGGMREGGIPVFDTLKEAIHCFPEINASLIAVPGRAAKDAVLEALYNGISFITILTEGIPVADVASIIAMRDRFPAVILGPSSVGIISPGICKVGSIGSGGIADRVFKKGCIGVMSKSGGMTAEICRVISEQGLGVSTALGLGGDPLSISDFRRIGRLFEKDRNTKAIVLFGEIGGFYEERFALAVGAGEITKPVVALIAGEFSQSLSPGTTLGHAGAIVSRGAGSYVSKINSLRKAGVKIAKTPEEVPSLLKASLAL